MQEKTIYALGFFDGVHLGHQALLNTCKALAAEYDCAAGVQTFGNHPDALVEGKAPGLINSIADREALLREMGMERVVVLPFDNALMHTPWQDYFQRLLTEFHAGGIVCGYDFRFGDRGAGNGEKLLSACKEAGIPCRVVPEQKVEGLTVSSTCIRGFLAEGNIAEANRFLGHPHRLTGKVVAGHQLGRTMGIPTANIAVPAGVALPKYGVYACKALVDGEAYPAVTNIGLRPTVGGHHVTVEPWLLDYDGDLYGRELTLLFYDYLREERKFQDLDALQAEIRKNADQTRKFFEKT